MSSASLVAPLNDERTNLPPVGFGLGNDGDETVALSLKPDDSGGCGIGDNDNLVFADLTVPPLFNAAP